MRPTAQVTYPPPPGTDPARRWRGRASSCVPRWTHASMRGRRRFNLVVQRVRTAGPEIEEQASCGDLTISPARSFRRHAAGFEPVRCWKRTHLTPPCVPRLPRPRGHGYYALHPDGACGPITDYASSARHSAHGPVPRARRPGHQLLASRDADQDVGLSTVAGGGTILPRTGACSSSISASWHRARQRSRHAAPGLPREMRHFFPRRVPSTAARTIRDVCALRRRGRHDRALR